MVHTQVSILLAPQLAQRPTCIAAAQFLCLFIFKWDTYVNYYTKTPVMQIGKQLSRIKYNRKLGWKISTYDVNFMCTNHENSEDPVINNSHRFHCIINLLRYCFRNIIVGLQRKFDKSFGRRQLLSWNINLGQFQYIHFKLLSKFVREVNVNEC